MVGRRQDIHAPRRAPVLCQFKLAASNQELLIGIKRKKAQIRAKILNRKLHRWAAILTALPVLIVMLSGIILQMKKEFDWVQPPTMKGAGKDLALSFDKILDIAGTVPEVEIKEWEDIDRLDVRPGKGVVKVRAKNRWELQIDTTNGKVLQVAVCRSDLIESIHDGSFFHEKFKLWVFLPSAIVLAGIWGTGMYLFLFPYINRRNRKKIKHQYCSKQRRGEWLYL
ncbi:MAG: PepSY domain-containing protein [Deltaproteobacteria bacterium]|nr:PepSY domain-containing protein [Deltaproteobacteria bacterium]